MALTKPDAVECLLSTVRKGVSLIIFQHDQRTWQRYQRKYECECLRTPNKMRSVPLLAPCFSSDSRKKWQETEESEHCRTEASGMSKVRDQKWKWCLIFNRSKWSKTCLEPNLLYQLLFCLDSWILCLYWVSIMTHWCDAEPNRSGQLAWFLLLNHSYCNELSWGSQSVQIRLK